LPFFGRVIAIAAASLAAAALLAAAAGLLPSDVQVQPAPTADFACPPTGTVFTMSMPLALSAEAVFRNRVTIKGHDGFDCDIGSEANGAYWLHAHLVNRIVQKELQVAAESLWPLRVGNTARADVQYGGQHWTIRFKVASYEKFTARVGPYDAFKIIETHEADGKLAYETTRWWSPALRYTLSYQRDRMLSSTDQAYYEVAAVDSPDP
jgi:hypothetical protein